MDGYVQIIQMGDDLGTQQALEISPRLYREVFKPRQKLIFETVKRRSNLRVFLHSCGAIADIIPDLIEVGVEILNPVQTSARGMDPARLKREFGKDITFWGGGCDTQRVLPDGDARGDRRPRPRSGSRRSPPAADSSSPRSTTSCPTSRPATSSPCATPSTDTVNNIAASHLNTPIFGIPRR